MKLKTYQMQCIPRRCAKDSSCLWPGYHVGPSWLFDAVISAERRGTLGPCHEVRCHMPCGMGYVGRGLQGKSAGSMGKR
jgi:hypothetical protein